MFWLEIQISISEQPNIQFITLTNLSLNEILSISPEWFGIPRPLIENFPFFFGYFLIWLHIQEPSNNKHLPSLDKTIIKEIFTHIKSSLKK